LPIVFFSPLSIVLEMRAPHGGGTGVKNDTTDVGVVTVDDTTVLPPNTKNIGGHDGGKAPFLRLIHSPNLDWYSWESHHWHNGGGQIAMPLLERRRNTDCHWKY
jgi:hypothetical protein